MHTFTTFDTVEAAVGSELGTGEWLTIDQERVDAFADVTGDHQWIHVDPERAASGPFGTTVAHGYLTLSLVPALTQGVVVFETPGAKLNYGLERVRFPSPVPVGSRVRAHVTLREATRTDRGLRVVLSTTVEIEGSDRPACVAETVVLLVA